MRLSSPVSRRHCLGLLAALPWATLPARPAHSRTAEVLVARTPAPNPVTARFATYTHALLELAFAETAEFGPSRVDLDERSLERRRVEAELDRGDRISVFLMPGTNAYDRRFLRISLPVDRGLMGFRIGQIRRADTGRFSAIRSVDDLRQIRIGSVLGWYMSDILHHNGLTVDVLPTAGDLYPMLQRGRIDMILRGATDIQQEQVNIAADMPDIGIEESLLVHLPVAQYLYVSREQPALYHRLETGLRRAVDSGRFDSLFYGYYGPPLESLTVSGRTRIDLTDPDPHGPTANAPPGLLLSLPSLPAR
ncbi:type 2 periplasmic-binding domain-containing protein [Novispirillum itersonii]|uniref:hypothetical protein n=1 Tax=Novispirillum itersonii TaxID=189 RepID=UPI000378DBA6|nr:hypothetical protein [Novispirillum itersonii]